MDEMLDNTIQLRASGLRQWLTCGVFASVPILALFWFRNDLSDGVCFIAGWNIAVLLRLFVLGVRRYDVTLTCDSIQGPVKANWLDPGDSREVELREVDLAHSGRHMLTDWRLKLFDGRQMLLSSGFYPRRRIRSLYEELQRRAECLRRDAAPPTDACSA